MLNLTSHQLNKMAYSKYFKAISEITKCINASVKDFTANKIPCPK
jgi:hypothetical protein